MKFFNKVILSILIILFILGSTCFTNAANNYTIEPAPVLDADSQGFRNMVGKVIGLIKWIAIVGSVIALSILGLKYMMGSLEEKAQYKKSMVPWVVGTAIVAISSTIVDFIYNTLTF